MAIQMRRGDYTDFDPTQLLDGELAVVLENDPDTDDGTGFYVSFGDDNVKRVAMADELESAGSGIYYGGSISNPTNGCFTVTVDESFELTEGVAILVWVNGYYTGSALTSLNVNSTGEKWIRGNSGQVTLKNLEQGKKMLLVYGSGYWNIVGEYNKTWNKVLTGISSTAAATAEKVTNIVCDNVMTGMIAIVIFTNDNTASPSSLKLNVTYSSGSNRSASIQKNGAALTEADNLKAGIPYVFRNDGTYWQLIGVLPDGIIEPSDTAPASDGTASAGSSTDYARADHVHPTDATRAAASDLTAHTSDTTAHVTAAERAAWDAKASTDTATTSANGLMSASDKSKLDGIGTKANGYYTTEKVNGDTVLTMVYDLVEE